MASKFGSVAERLIGAVVWFVPDGENLGTVQAPEIIGPAAKPVSPADWEDYHLGRITQSAYDPVTQERTRTFFSQERMRYVQDRKVMIMTDAFNVTMVDYAADLFDELMFGLGEPIAADTEQPVFAKNVREKSGWVRMLRVNEDKTPLCIIEMHVKILIQENPPDSFEPGSPVWRIEHLADADPEIETIIFEPAPAE